MSFFGNVSNSDGSFEAIAFIRKLLGWVYWAFPAFLLGLFKDWFE